MSRGTQAHARHRDLPGGRSRAPRWRPSRAPRGRWFAGAAAAFVAVALAACTPKPAVTEVASDTAVARTTRPGGTLTALALGPVLTWDPQRISSRADAAFAGRVFVRTLTAYSGALDAGERARLVGDLATDTGSHDATLKTWTFHLREGLQWQDGSTVTCADVRYGIGRAFARTIIHGGISDAPSVLAVPLQPDGSSTYAGPWDTSASSAAGRTAFEQAVTCDGSTITFHLTAPVADFPDMLTQPAWAPVKADQDHASEGRFDVFSCGPYQLSGSWTEGEGGTFVRNTHWSAASDPVRKAYPDSIVYREGVEMPTVAQQITSDEGVSRTSVALTPAPASLQLSLTSTEALKGRYVTPLTSVVDYLAPNEESETFAGVEERRALALATDRAAYLRALGGEAVGILATSVLPVTLGVAAAAADDFNPSAAKALLTQAGHKAPVPIKVAYRSSETSDKAMAALLEGWRRGGFVATLVPVKDNYFETISAAGGEQLADVFWANWAPSWSSADTVLPNLFDSRLNLVKVNAGRDVGRFADPELDTAMDQAGAMADRGERDKAWSALDGKLRNSGAYIALMEHRSLLIAGSGVANLAGNPMLGGTPDLADLGVLP